MDVLNVILHNLISFAGIPNVDMTSKWQLWSVLSTYFKNLGYSGFDRFKTTLTRSNLFINGLKSYTQYYGKNLICKLRNKFTGSSFLWIGNHWARIDPTKSYFAVGTNLFAGFSNS